MTDTGNYIAKPERVHGRLWPLGFVFYIQHKVAAIGSYVRSFAI